MILNNMIIKKSKLASFLICKNNLINYYKKFLWKKNNKIIIRFVDSHVILNTMFFNFAIKNIKNDVNIFIHR
jgi:hypothetical protein